MYSMHVVQHGVCSGFSESNEVQVISSSKMNLNVKICTKSVYWSHYISSHHTCIANSFANNWHMRKPKFSSSWLWPFEILNTIMTSKSLYIVYSFYWYCIPFLNVTNGNCVLETATFSNHRKIPKIITIIVFPFVISFTPHFMCGLFILSASIL